MSTETLLPLLRQLAGPAGVRVVRERAAGDARPTGVCVLKGTVVVVLDPATPAVEECHLLLDALRKVDLSGIFVPPAVREALD